MQEGLPRFSIIVPTYNRPGHLKSCLEAICSLDYPAERFEVIVVNDGSQLPLDPVVATYRDKVDLTLISKRNGGPGAARNYGAKIAKGQFFAFTDDDCFPAADWLKSLAARFAKSSTHAIGGRTLNALPHNLYSRASQMIVDFAYAHYNTDPDQAHFFASNNLALRGDFFNAIGGFITGWPAAEDRELCDRWIHYGYRMAYAPEAVVYHAHALNLRGFWRQHMNYGRGAFLFQRTRTQRGLGPFKPECRFYINVFRHCFINKHPRLLPILATWQLANTAGFLYEMTRQRSRKTVNDTTVGDHK